MKRIALLGMVVAMALVQSVKADVVTTWTFGGGAITDGSLVGNAFNGTVYGMPSQITDVNVHLNVTGTWNGDLYAYLVHGTEPGFAVLLNRVGRDTGNTAGWSTAGMDVWLSDGAALGDIHTVQNPTSSATYQPDGRMASPLSVVTGDTRSAFLSSFIGGNPNGNWTLYLADVSAGDQSVVGWQLEIAAVPEPASLIEGSVAVLFLSGIVWLYRRKAARQQPQAC